MQIPLVQFYCEKVGPDDVTHLRIASREFEDDDEAVNEINPSSEPDLHGGRRLRLRDRYGNTAPVRCECGDYVRKRSAGVVNVTEEENIPSKVEAYLNKFKAKFVDTFGSPP